MDLNQRPMDYKSYSPPLYQLSYRRLTIVNISFHVNC